MPANSLPSPSPAVHLPRLFPSQAHTSPETCSLSLPLTKLQTSEIRVLVCFVTTTSQCLAHGRYSESTCRLTYSLTAKWGSSKPPWQGGGVAQRESLHTAGVVSLVPGLPWPPFWSPAPSSSPRALCCQPSARRSPRAAGTQSPAPGLCKLPPGPAAVTPITAFSSEPPRADSHFLCSQLGSLKCCRFVRLRFDSFRGEQSTPAGELNAAVNQ